MCNNNNNNKNKYHRIENYCSDCRVIIIKTNIIELKITVAIAELSIYILALSLSLSLMELLSYNS
jgi:hypothetical protein